MLFSPCYIFDQVKNKNIKRIADSLTSFILSGFTNFDQSLDQSFFLLIFPESEVNQFLSQINWSIDIFMIQPVRLTDKVWFLLAIHLQFISEYILKYLYIHTRLKTQFHEKTHL